MMIRRMVYTVVAGTVALGLSACASTSMVQSWKDPNYAGGPMHKVLLIGVSANDGNRRVFEDRFRAELSAEKVDAIASYTVLPSQNLTEADIKGKAIELGVDGVVISRVIDKKTVETIYPPTTTYVAGYPYYPSYYGGYYGGGYYGGAYAAYTSPGYVETTDYVYVETNVYDARDSGKLVWTGLSESAIEPGRVNELIDGVVGTLMNELRKAKR